MLVSENLGVLIWFPQSISLLNMLKMVSLLTDYRTRQAVPKSTPVLTLDRVNKNFQNAIY